MRRPVVTPWQGCRSSEWSASTLPSRAAVSTSRQLVQRTSLATLIVIGVALADARHARRTHPRRSDELQTLPSQEVDRAHPARSGLRHPPPRRDRDRRGPRPPPDARPSRADGRRARGARVAHPRRARRDGRRDAALRSGMDACSRRIRAPNASSASPRSRSERRSKSLGRRIVDEDGVPCLPEDLPAAVTLRTGQPTTHRVIGLVRETGEVRWCRRQHALIRRADDERPSACLSVFRDVTDERQLEEERIAQAQAQELQNHELLEQAEALERGQALFRSLVDTAGSAIVGMRMDGTVFEWNREAEALFGVPRADAIGRDYVSTFATADYRAQISPTASTRCSRARSCATSCGPSTARTASGVRCIWNVTPLRAGEGGAVHGLIAAGVDITEREASDERFRILFERSSDAHLLLDDSGVIDCNDATLRMLRCVRTSDVEGRSLGRALAGAPARRPTLGRRRGADAPARARPWLPPLRVDASAQRRQHLPRRDDAHAGAAQRARGHPRRVARHRRAEEGGARAAHGEGCRRVGEPHEERVHDAHEPRAAHAAHGDHRLLARAARGEGGPAHRQRAALRRAHSRERHAPAVAHQPDPRRRQGRSRSHGARDGDGGRRRPRARHDGDARVHRACEGDRAAQPRAGGGRADRHRRGQAASRSSST